MSTRSLNIIKEHNKLVIFWMHWDGATAADTILNWSPAERKFAVGKILANQGNNSVVSAIHTKKQIKDNIKRAANDLFDAVAAVQERDDDDCHVNGRLDRLKELDYVNFEPFHFYRTFTFSCPASEIGPMVSFDQVCSRIEKLSGKPLFEDIQIGNFIDFDTKTCRFDYSFDTWNNELNDYETKTIDFSTAIPFSKIKKLGQMEAMGIHQKP